MKTMKGRIAAITRDGLVVAATAAVTAALVWASSAAIPWATASKEQGASVPPSLEVQGVVLALTPDKTVYGAGDTPVLTLEALNGLDSAQTVEVEVAMTATLMASPASRMLPMPETIWSHRCIVTLDPGESRSVQIPTETALAGGNLYFMTMAAGGKTLRAAGFAIPRPGEQTDAGEREMQERRPLVSRLRAIVGHEG